MVQLIRAFILVVGLVGATVSATPTKKCAFSDYRLPEHIAPKHYNLFLTLEAKENRCGGMVQIKLESNGNMNKDLAGIIVLNAHRDVEVTKVDYFEMQGEASSSSNLRLINVVDFCQDDENELLVVQLGRDLAENAISYLEVWFIAKIRDDSTGIYKTEYKTQAGAISYQISTDFKPNKARRAFPCFDEPSFKATFEITLNYDPEMVALSNTDPVSTGNDAGFRTSTFMRTPNMSTYLVAFVIGEFDYIESFFFGERLEIRAFTRVSKSHHAQFALDTAVNAIRYLEEYFAIPFPSKKLDMVSVVKHNTDATENWGLIVCNETSFLFDPENMSPISKGDIAKTVIQAVTKQWFGNLVTLKWWDDLWLQEGFAGWMANSLIDRMYPKLQWELNYLIERQQTALEKDTGADVRPIRVAVDRTNIDGILDDHLLVKSAAVIRLLHDDYVGPEQFQDGIRRHLDDNKHGNADASELCKTLTTLSKKRVGKFIESWTEQPGHPLVTVILAPKKRKFNLRQAPESLTIRPDPVWIIPVTILVSDSVNEPKLLKFILDQTLRVVDMPDWFDVEVNENSWIKVNEHSRGFYHVHHAMKSWSGRLQRPCEAQDLSASDRIGLIDDHEAEVRSGQYTLQKLMKVFGWFNLETEGSVLGRFARTLLTQMQNFKYKTAQVSEEVFNPAYQRNRLSNEYLQMAGTDNGMGLADAHGFITAYSFLLNFHWTPLVHDALTLFDNNKEKRVEPFIRELVYKAVALYGSEKQINELQSLLQLDTDSEEEKNRIEAAIKLYPQRQRRRDTNYKRNPIVDAILPERIKRQRVA